jgi:hypothetical protein
MKTCILVACGMSKTPGPMPARDLYTSTLFKAGRAYAEKFSDRWYILSALHGVVEPHTVLDPYDVTLRTPDERRAWGARVAQWYGWEGWPPQETRIVLLAGRNYAWYPRTLLVEKGYTVEMPLANMGLGKRVQWLQQQIRE